MNSYESRKEARIERLRKAAEKARQEGDRRQENASRMAGIMNGQPILIGHHSEKHHRRDLERMDNNMRKSFELHKKADHYEDQAQAAESNRAISSDDPEAPQKLREKIDQAERFHAKVKGANKIIAGKPRNQITPEKIAALIALGFSQVNAEKLFTPDYMGKIGFASYVLTNNNANIHRLKERLQEIEAKAQDQSTEKMIGEVRVVDNVEENRLQLFFPAIPAEDLRHQLKAHGFRYSRFNGCWQAFRGSNARYWAEQILKTVNQEPNNA